MFRYFVECNFRKTKRNISPMFSGPSRWQAMRWMRYKPGVLPPQSQHIPQEHPPASRVVKAVFGPIARSRLSTYSIVLRSAQKEGVQSDDLAQWIEAQGGVQAIKLKQSPNFVKPADKAKHANTQLSVLPSLANVKTEALAKFADGDFVGESCVLIAEQNADGSFDIKAVVRSGAALTAALGSVYSEQKKAAQGL